MHVAVGNADETSRHAAARQLDGVGVGACPTTAGAPLDGHFGSLGGYSEPVDNARVHVWAAIDDGTAAQLDVAFLRLIDRRAISGMRYVDGDANVWVDA